MFKVLVHPHGARSPGLFYSLSLLYSLFQLLSQPLILSLCLGLLASASIPVVTAQGLTVIDSPAPNSPLHAGSGQGIALDVSAGNSGQFVYNSLQVYLVSAATATNVTVSNSSQLLVQEPGSTVKHIYWPVPTCLQPGAYNLTVYESSTFTSNGTSYFAIMTVPVQVANSGTPDPISCSSELNAVQSQPQASNPPPVDIIPGRGNSSPAGSSNSKTAVATPTSAPGQVITVTIGNGDITIPISNLPGTIVVEPSGGAPPETTATDVSSGFTTVFKTIAPTATLTVTVSQPITVTYEETFVSTFTASGQVLEETVTQTQTLVSTVEVVQTQVSSPEQAGLLPVNSGSRVMSSLSAVTLLFAVSTSAFVYVLHPAFAIEL